MSIRRDQLSLERGQERAADGTDFDVTAWREDVLAKAGTDFRLEVAKGNVAGHSVELVACESNTIGTSLSTFWDIATPLILATAGEALELVSSNAADTAAGIGAKAVIVVGLDDSYNSQTEVVVTNGGTVATVATNWIHISNIVAISSGSNQNNVGLITLQVAGGGNIRASMLASNGRSFNSTLIVPAGKTAFISQVQIWSAKGQDIIARPSFMADGTNTLFSGGDVPAYQGQVGVTYQSFPRLVEKTILKWTVKSSNPAQSGSLLYEVMLIDNDIMDLA